MWKAAGEMSSEHVVEGVKENNGIWWESSEPLEGRAFKGGGKALQKMTSWDV